MAKGVKIFKTENAIVIQPVMPIEACGKVYRGRQNCEKYVKKSLLLSIVIDAYHQNSRLFTDLGHFTSPLWVFNWVYLDSWNKL